MEDGKIIKKIIKKKRIVWIKSHCIFTWYWLKLKFTNSKFTFIFECFDFFLDEQECFDIDYWS